MDLICLYRGEVIWAHHTILEGVCALGGWVGLYLALAYIMPLYMVIL